MTNHSIKQYLDTFSFAQVMGRKSKGKKKAAAEEESAAGVVIVVDKPPEFDWAALKADILSADDEAVVEVPVGKKRKKGKKVKIQ